MVVFSLLILSNTFSHHIIRQMVQAVRIEVKILVYEIDYCISEIIKVLYIVF